MNADDLAQRFVWAQPALTFDDVLLVPALSDVLPREVSLATRVGEKLTLNIPLFAAAMDTVSEAPLAIAIAREGGMAVIHKNLTIAAQAEHVRRVKASDPRFAKDVTAVLPGSSALQAVDTMREIGAPELPVVDEANKLVGVLTRRSLLLHGADCAVSERMGEVSMTLGVDASVADARALFREHGFARLFVVDRGGSLCGVMGQEHLELHERFPKALRDAEGRLMTAAAVGPSGDCDDRIAALVAAGADCIVVDTAHGHSRNVLEAVARARAAYPNLALVAGNIATAEAVEALARAGADVVKVGIGPGSICTTRIVSGVGMPQVSAIFDCVAAARKYGVGVIADGGIKHSGDMVKALAAGADAVMVGSLLAGTDEAPGDVVLRDGIRFKAYRGMGSLGAMQQGSKDRYFQEHTSDADKLVPEGVEAVVPCKGPMQAIVHQLMGGLRSGMGYTGCSNLPTLQRSARFVRMTGAGLAESHVHGVNMSRPSPNYSQ